MKYILLILLGFSITGTLSAQSLEELLQEALENNPQIQQFQTRYEIASEKVQESNTLPNTEVGAGYFVSEPETRTGPQRFKLSVKQMIPWFGSISARENYSESLAETKFEDIVIIKRKLAMEVSQSYYHLYALRAKQQVLAENIDLLGTYETMALTSLEVGKASAVDVLRLQMRENGMKQRLAVLEENFEAEQAKMNSFLNRESNMVIRVPENVPIPQESLEIQVDSLKVHPELIKLDKLYASVEQSEALNQKSQKPMIGFGIDYINVSERPNMDFSDNGKDILMPMVSVSIPIFNNTFNSISQQNRLRLKELEYQKQDRLNTLKTLLKQAVSNRKAARISYSTLEENIHQAKEAENILLKSYETGTIDFKDVLDVQELQLQFELNQIDMVKEYYLQTMLIAYLTNE